MSRRGYPQHSRFCPVPPADDAPKSPDDVLDDRYVEACQMLEPMDYLASMLAAGTLEQRIRTVDRLLADGKMDQLEEQLNRIKEQELEEEN